MTPTGEVVPMLMATLRGLALGIAGVFIVLAVFYLALRLLMGRASRG
jgi:hypothetical protein